MRVVFFRRYLGDAAAKQQESGKSAETPADARVAMKLESKLPEKIPDILPESGYARARAAKFGSLDEQVSECVDSV